MTRAFIRSLMRWHAAQGALTPVFLVPMVDWEDAAFQRDAAEQWAAQLQVMIEALTENLGEYERRPEFDPNERAVINGRYAIEALKQAHEHALEHLQSFAG